MKKKKPPKTIEEGLDRLGDGWIITVWKRDRKTRKPQYAIEDTLGVNGLVYFETSILDAIRAACKDAGK